MVIAIIGVVAAMLLPALNSARKKAYTVSCVTNLKQWSAAFEMYSQDNNGLLFYSMGTLPGCTTFNWDDTSCGTVTNVYLRYLGGGDILLRLRTMRICPAVRGRMSDAQVRSSNLHTYSLSFPDVLGSRGSWGPMGDTPLGSGNYFINLRGLSKPAEFLLLMDSGGKGVETSLIVGQMLKSATAAPTGDDPTGQTAIGRHGGGVNCLFADGHVVFVPAAKLAAQDALPVKDNTWFQSELATLEPTRQRWQLRPSLTK